MLLFDVVGGGVKGAVKGGVKGVVSISGLGCGGEAFQVSLGKRGDDTDAGVLCCFGCG